MSTRALSQPRATTNHRAAARLPSLGALSVYAFLVLVLIVTLCPFVWVVLASLNTTQGILSSQIVPTSFQWDNYPRAWRTGNLGSYVGNSVVAGIATVAMTLSVCCPAGYAFGRLRFPGVKPLFYVYLFGLTIPFQAILIPIFYQLKNLDLLDSLLGIILIQVGIGVPFGTFLMRNFFRGLPGELADAARIDGCTELGVFWRVMLPLVRPAALALLLFSFANSWNDYALPLIALQTDARRTLPVGLVHFSGQYATDYSLVFAATVISFIPVVLVYLLFQRQFVEGINAGALKG